MPLISGKQLRDSSIDDDKLAVSYLKADGSRPLTSDLDLGGHRLTGLTAPVNDSDAARKIDIQVATMGLDFKDACQVATTHDLILAGSLGVEHDGVPLTEGMRVLVRAQDDARANGIYIASSGAWERSADANVSAEVTSGLYTFVLEGTQFAGVSFVLVTSDPIILETTSLSFTTFASAARIVAGSGLTQSAFTLSVGEGDGITVNEDEITIDLSGTTLTKVGGLRITDFSVGTTQLTDEGVTTAKILDANVTEDKLAANAVTTAKILDASVTEDKLAANAVTTAKILDASVTAAKLAADIAGDGIIYTAGVLAVGSGDGITVNSDSITVTAANSSVNVDTDGVKAAVPTRTDKELIPSDTTGDGHSSGIAITEEPSGDGYVQVLVNGIQQILGDGLKTKDCYFSSDAGLTAKNIAEITAGDVLYWNGTISGFDLTTIDRMDINYNVII